MVVPVPMRFQNPNNEVGRKMRGRVKHGNTTALVVTLVGVLALLIVFFALNFNQIFGTHKEAQTAIDAAALQAARDAVSYTHLTLPTILRV